MQWQVKFSIIWASALGFFLLLSIPRIVRAVRTGRGQYDFRNWVGIKEHHDPALDYDFIADTGEAVKPRSSWARWALSRYLDNVAGILNAFFCLTIPKIGVNVGQGQSHFQFR
jgi:ferric-chelate reductase